MGDDMKMNDRVAGSTEPRTYHRTLAWTLVVVFTVVSVILNGLHAVMMQWDGQEGGWFGAVLLAVMAPVSLLLATHLLVGLIQDWTHRRRWLVRLRGTVAGVFAVIGVIAFVMSFAALRDMAERYGMASGLSWMAPVIIDSVILAGTLAVVIAEAEMRLDREEAAADRVSEQWTAGRTSQVNERDEQVADRHSAWVSEEPDVGGSTGTYLGDHPVEQQSAKVIDLSDERVSESLSDQPDERSTGVSESSVSDRTDDRASELSGRPDEQGSADWLAVAERVRAATGITAELDDLARVLEMDEAGSSRREIAEAVGRPKSTVSGWIGKASAVDEHPRLTAAR